jgi:L-alanine-DL-glutamate epimerase-like enolase superfamily enzyme
MVASAGWTLRAAAAGKPLWQLWGGERSVEVSWTVTRQKPAAMAKEAAESCSRCGFRTLKVKGGQGLETDLRALAEIRAAVGPRVELCVDANGAYPREEAPGYVRRIAQAGAAVAEDPSPLAPDAQFEALQKGASIPILVDNSCSTARDAALYLERGVRAISLKPGRVGLSETRAVQALASLQGAKMTVGIYGESVLGTLVNLQQAAALARPHALAAEQSFFLEMGAQVSKLAPEIRGGCIELPAEADLSRLVDWDAVKRYAL